MTEHNVILKGGPRDGMLIHLSDTTTSLIEGGVNGAPVEGEWRRTSETEDGRTIFRWSRWLR